MKADHSNQKVLDFSIRDLPQTVPARDTATSQAAAKKVERTLGRMHGIVLSAFASTPDVTPDDVSARTGIFLITCRVRCGELRKWGYLTTTGEGRSIQDNPMDKLSLTAKGEQYIESLK